MNIVFMVSTMHTGGAERVAANLVNNWSKQGHHVTLVATYSGRGECHYVIESGVKMVYLSDLVVEGPFIYLRRFIALRRFIIGCKPDIVVSFLPNVNVAAILASFGLNIPVVVSERIHPPQMPIGWFWGLLRRITYPLAKQVVVQSRETLGWLRASIPRAEGVIIQNPIDFPLIFSEPEVAVEKYIPPGRKMLLAVGRLDPQKQFKCLISAFARLADKFPDWVLIILGEGHEHDSLAKLVLSLGLDNRVFFPGRVGNVGSWYQSADIYVMSSRFEGFPNTLLEAMAYGCPVVSFDCDTGPRDLIIDEINGLLVKPVGDETALLGALDRLMGDSGLRVRLGEAATEVQGAFKLERISEQWLALFHRLVLVTSKR
ncbi:glycosyltransferase family 4 protein [Dechloromonas sp. XY25]|uniref:Glycosyltransferase family 4 protein n=1 Tax=Dechloromonas hankyongensis TaxID=2908002 RepID=A0ABS9K1Q3_9RHOO|nr:glycosyltransferase family 4 protein [Dechloromonas hankyongensis]MCG2577108.1 glycosyltransferase family 4 protein [Dechloromonas hankyongensis]